MTVYYAGCFFLNENPSFNRDLIKSPYHGSFRYVHEENEKIISSKKLGAFLDDNWFNILQPSGFRVPDNYSKYFDLLTKDVHEPIYDDLVLYEKICDKNGNIYGKEIITGLIFPIICNENVDKEYIINYFDCMFSVSIICTSKIPIMDKCYSWISESNVADNNVVLAYKNSFGKSKSRKWRKHFKSMTKLYNNNVFNSEIVSEKKVYQDRNKQSLGTSVMENIEYLLGKLKLVDEEAYQSYLNKYNSIISQDYFTTSMLALLEGEIEASLMLQKKNGNTIDEYLDSLKVNYLNGIINNEEINDRLDVKKIDEVEDIFLKTKDKYSLIAQRKILKDLAFIYLMEVYMNIDNIEYEDLKDSYFSDNLKTIYVIIQALKDLGVITVDIATDLNEELNLRNVLLMIKSIRFNKEMIEQIDKEELVRKLCVEF